MYVFCLPPCEREAFCLPFCEAAAKLNTGMQGVIFVDPDSRKRNTHERNVLSHHSSSLHGLSDFLMP